MTEIVCTERLEAAMRAAPRLPFAFSCPSCSAAQGAPCAHVYAPLAAVAARYTDDVHDSEAWRNHAC
jgi:hypothetical protein